MSEKEARRFREESRREYREASEQDAQEAGSYMVRPLLSVKDRKTLLRRAPGNILGLAHEIESNAPPAHRESVDALVSGMRDAAHDLQRYMDDHKAVPTQLCLAELCLIILEQCRGGPPPTTQPPSVP